MRVSLETIQVEKKMTMSVEPAMVDVATRARHILRARAAALRQTPEPTNRGINPCSNAHFAPTAVNLAMNSSASSFFKSFFNTAGAPSTSSFASRAEIGGGRTSLMTLISARRRKIPV